MIPLVLKSQKMKPLPLTEYLLVLSPHEELRNRILQIRAAFHEAYQAPTAMTSKPYLTLVAFSQRSMMEERIIQRLRTIALGYYPFKVELKDFGSFPSHTLFINVTSKLPIRGLVKQIREMQRLMKADHEHKPHFIDEPYILIARKLLPWQYEQGWLEYSNRTFSGRFIADSMLLLKREEGERAWQIAGRFTFEHLPVSIRQGELFA